MFPQRILRGGFLLLAEHLHPRVVIGAQFHAVFSAVFARVFAAPAGEFLQARAFLFAVCAQLSLALFTDARGPQFVQRPHFRRHHGVPLQLLSRAIALAQGLLHARDGLSQFRVQLVLRGILHADVDGVGETTRGGKIGGIFHGRCRLRGMHGVYQDEIRAAEAVQGIAQFAQGAVIADAPGFAIPQRIDLGHHAGGRSIHEFLRGAQLFGGDQERGFRCPLMRGGLRFHVQGVPSGWQGWKCAVASGGGARLDLQMDSVSAFFQFHPCPHVFVFRVVNGEVSGGIREGSDRGLHQPGPPLFTQLGFGCGEIRFRGLIGHVQPKFLQCKDHRLFGYFHPGSILTRVFGGNPTEFCEPVEQLIFGGGHAL